MSTINDKAREVSADSYSGIQAQITGALIDFHTALPAIVIDYDANTRTITAQPTVQRVFSEGEGLSGAHNLPPCVDVPVVFPMGGGYELTFPVVAGDECLLIFAERCIDGWFTTGQPTPPQDYRRHDLSDAFAIVGVRSLANKQPVWNGGAELHGNGNHIRIGADSVEFGVGDATLKLTSDKLISSVPIHAPNLITSAMDINAHTHGGVKSGGDSTGVGS